MAYTNVKVTYVGTDEKKLDAEKKGVKPDYHEFDTKVAEGKIKTNYNDLQTTWLTDSGFNNNPNRGQTTQSNVPYASGSGPNFWAGYNTGTFPDEADYLRNNYNPRTIGNIVKQIHMIHGKGQNSNGENLNIPHYGDSVNGQYKDSNMIPDGMWAYFTPVLNDSMIEVECKYTAFSVNGSYPIWQWSMFCDDVQIQSGFERHYAMGTMTHTHTVRTNSWGAGRQMLVAFGFNSYNNSHRMGIYGGAEGNGYDRCFSITEYKNANPYGPAVIKWSHKNVNF